MKRLIALLILVFVMLNTSQSQTWDYFFHPRPPIEMTQPILDRDGNQISGPDGMVFRVATYVPIEWQFHPTLTINATCVRPSIASGVSSDVEFLSAAGPALTLQHTGSAPDGSNYADYSANLSLLLSGSTNSSPSIVPALAVTAGLFNNALEVGGGVDLVKRSDGLSQFFVLISIGVNITNNN